MGRLLFDAGILVKGATELAKEAKAIAEQTKTTADTAAASVNEYMDALLGLSETEATDAE